MPKCGNCETENKFSAPVVIITIFGSALPDGVYALIPAEDYSACLSCNSLERLVKKAVEAHPVTRSKVWATAIIIFKDKSIKTLENQAEWGAYPLSKA